MKQNYDLSILGAKAASNNSQSNAYDLTSLGATLNTKNNNNSSMPPINLGWRGIGQDILDKVDEIPSILNSFPNQLKGISEQYQNEPTRIVKNLLAGTGEGIISTLNLPHDAFKYFSKKQLIPEWLQAYSKLPFTGFTPYTHIPSDLGVEKKMGLGENKPGDALLKLIPQLVSSYAAKKMLGPRSISSLENEVEQGKNFIERTNEQHKAFLGEGQEHGARASQQFLDHIEGKENPETGKREGGLRRQIGSQYENLAQDMSKENVQIHQTPDLKAIQKSLRDIGKGVSGAEKEKLLQMMVKSDSKLKTINGADALTSYRELKRQKNKSYQNAFDPGIGPKEHEGWIKKANDLGQLEQRMKSMLEKQIGGKYLERLKNIDKEYATKIAPLAENSMYQEMRKHGQTSKNIMKYLHGTTEGNQTLNSIVNQTPELQRVIVGQKFAASPEKLASEQEAIKKYQKMNPVISKIIEEQQQSKQFKSTIPELEKSIADLSKKKEKKRNRRIGALATLGALGGGYALETALDRDWKKDVPLLADLFMLHKLKNMKK